MAHGALFTYNTIHPVNRVKDSINVKQDPNNHHWIIVSRVPLSVIAEKSAQFEIYLAQTMMLLLLVAGLTSYFLARTWAQRWQLENRLQSSMAGFEALLRGVGEGILVLDADGHIILVNEALHKTFGFTEAQLLGEPISKLLPEKNRSNQEPLPPDLRSLGQHYQCLASHADGRAFPVEIRFEKIDSTGRTNYVGAIRDITEQVQSSANLKIEKESAEAANRAKSEFLATMSHEIRTPMNGVLGMVQVLEETELSEEQHQFARIIYNSGMNMMHILSDILDFSKIEAGQVDLEYLEFNLPELIESTVQLFFLPADAKDLELVCNIGTEIPLMIKGDDSRIRQIISNLLSNALKFTEQGKITVEITCVPKSDPGSEEGYMLVVAISDTGVGIPQEQQGVIFESFQQADSSVTRKYGGTGLGLTISQRLVQLMKGETGFESEHGKGSRFWFRLPLGKAESEVPILPGFEELQGKRVLIVDDNEMNRAFLESLCCGHQIPSYSVTNGVDALNHLRKQPASQQYDLLLLDYLMPDLNGLDLAKLIRADKNMPYLPIIMLTSARHLELADECRALGVESCISKPVLQSSILLGQMKKVIQRERISPAGEPKKERTARLDKGQKILVAEDDPVNRIVILTMLARLGYNTNVAENGLEVLELLEQERFDLILMDCHMPQLDGWETATRIRQLDDASEGLASLPLIAVTADAMSGDREKCLRAGMNDYLSKPIDEKKLSEMISRWLEKSADSPPVNVS